MIKFILGGVVAVSIVFGMIVYSLQGESEKIEQVDNAFSTLGDFAHNRVKTSEDVKLFNDLVNDDANKKAQ